MATHRERGDMLSGSITRQLVAFGLPLLFGNLFQQLYSSVDSIVVGRYVGTGALAAVGITTPLIFLFVSFFQGISTGANVVIAQFIGARQTARVRPGIATALVLSLAGGVLLMLAFIALTPPILRMMLTPQDVFAMTDRYMRIYLLSLPAIALYNAGTAVLRAMGDSRRPLCFLMVSSLLNVALDLLFVRTFSMGIQGAAIASVVAQYVSVALVLLVLLRHIGEHSLILGSLQCDREIAGRIFRLGVPSAVQSCAISLSNVMFQSQINLFGSDVVAGHSAGNRIDSFLYLPCLAFGLAATTFAGQNYGAGRLRRIRQGARISILLSAASTFTLSVTAYLLRAPLLSLFADDPAVLQYGALTMLVCGIPCFLWAFPQVYGCVLTGMGKSLSSMLIILFSQCGVRLLWIFSLLPFWRNVLVVLLSFPVSWIAGGSFMMVYYLRWMKRNIREADQSPPPLLPDAAADRAEAPR